LIKNKKIYRGKFFKKKKNKKKKKINKLVAKWCQRLDWSHSHCMKIVKLDENRG